MKYKMTARVCNPETPAGMFSDAMIKMTVDFSYDPDDYGNGHHVRIECEGLYIEYYDLRYDETFDPAFKEAWLANWAYRYWSGSKGAWDVKKLEIEKVGA